ncbi:DUF6538 domain-containing protein [Thermodesulfobacteriota bacterium]
MFRIKVPKDLQTQVGKKELRYSLRTGYIGLAKPKARLFAGQIQKLYPLFLVFVSREVFSMVI